MNRELKFRFWDSELKMMEAWEHAENWESLGKYLNGIDGYIAMQSTGVKDKNWKTIYEGDVIEFPDGYNNDEEFVSIGVVEWDESELCFYATNRQTVSCEQLWNNSDDIEVLGNIYENPELMNK